MAKIIYKKVKKLKPALVGYLAALIDGEGTITLPYKKSKRGNKYRQLSVTISNSDYELLRWVINTIGAGKITKKHPHNEKHALGYTYQLTSQQALDLITQIYSYLRTYKRKRAQLVLEKYKKLTPRNGKYSRKILIEREKFIKDFFAITGYRKGILKLNPRIQFKF